MKRSATTAIALAALAAVALVGGCDAYRPYAYHNEREMMQGPGLLSGEDGVFTIYGRKTAKQPQDAADASAGGEKAGQEDEPAR